MSVRMEKPSALMPARIRKPSRRPGPRKASPLVRLALSKEALKMNLPTASRIPQAMRRTCSSLSITHGPAISTSGAALGDRPKMLYSTDTRILGLNLHLRGQAAAAVLVGGANECPEQRMRLHGLGFELGVELAAEKPRMVRDFADLHVNSVRRLAGDAQAPRLQLVLVFAVELVAMAMALVNFAGAVGPVSETVFRQPAGPTAQTHGAAQFIHAFQLAQLEDHAMRRTGIEFGGIGVHQAAHIARILNHQGLHAQADAEVRHLALARVANRVEHAVDAALAEAARNQDAIVALQLPLPVRPHHALGFDPVNVHFQLVRQPAVEQGL